MAAFIIGCSSGAKLWLENELYEVSDFDLGAILPCEADNESGDPFRGVSGDDPPEVRGGADTAPLGDPDLLPLGEPRGDRGEPDPRVSCELKRSGFDGRVIVIADGTGR